MGYNKAMILAQKLTSAQRKKYNKYFIRAENPPVMRLTERDFQIIRYAAQFRLINTFQIFALVAGSHTVIRSRLNKLYHNGYLDRPPEQVEYYVSGSNPRVYALDKKGFEVLAEQGGLSDYKPMKRIRKNSDIKKRYIKHQLLITAFGAQLIASSQGRGHIKLLSDDGLLALLPEKTWQKDKPFNLTAHIVHASGAKQQTIEPDYVFALDDTGKKKRAFFFVEIDVGRMTIEPKSDLGKSSILKKFLTYHAYWKSQKHKSEFKWQSFRVLFVTNKQSRIKEMQACLSRHGALNNDLFWFATHQELEIDILSHKFHDGNGAAKRLVLGH
jgi:hypothetical protein